MSRPPAVAHSFFTDFDVSLFHSGKHYRLYEKFGAHAATVDGEEGVYFAVYAPAANIVFVNGDFNSWEGTRLNVRWDGSGIWEGFIPGVKPGEPYKYRIESTISDDYIEKADPFAQWAEMPPRTASLVWVDDYVWQDANWMKERPERQTLKNPFSIYEMHLGSWRRNADGSPLTYTQLAEELPAYISDMGFTHVEFLPIMEHPYDPSWGYQITGFFAPTHRYGSPAELKGLVDALHRAGIGVILDWVPSHFPSDGHGLGKFDGSSVYEHPDWRKGYHPDWDSLIFNYERPEVRSFLVSNALYWLEQFHIDGLRVDAVASMLYLDYSRADGAWEPNIYGGNENLEAIAFIRELNEAVYGHFPDVQMIAEESTAFAGVSHPTYAGGLGFGMKWMMGWMHDTLEYFSKPTVYRRFHHGSISFSIYYGFTENFVLPFSHDEVVHGKASLLHKMPGDEWQQFANLRLLFSYMFMHPGAKLLFMGGEIAQRAEWNFTTALDWHLLDYEPHQGIQALVRDLNHLYTTEKALYRKGFDEEGFEWIDYSDHEQCILSFVRKGGRETLVVVCNFTETAFEEYKVGVPSGYAWEEIFSSDDEKYGGSGVLNTQQSVSQKEQYHGRNHVIALRLPPLGLTVLRPAKKKTTPRKMKAKAQSAE